MNPRDAEVTYARLLGGHEDAMARLYRAFAAAFPSCAEQWQHMAADEISHSEWLQTLVHRIEDGSVSFDRQHSLNTSYIIEAVEQVEADASRAEQGALSLRDAFALALHYEGRMLERNWFRFFDSDSEELKRVFQSLAVETAKHARAIKQLAQGEGA